jgi:hypothetical protein
MARTFGMLGAASTGFTAVGVLRNFKRTTQAEVKYALTAAGVPEASNCVAGPKTISATLEVDGTVPVAGSTLTVDAVVFGLTKVEQSWEGDGAASTLDVEGSISL